MAKDGISPMMGHYLRIKEKYKDCIVFYRLGDFYEMFFEDAKEASQILELTLTGRDCGLEERAPMCGVPFHAADAYIAKLVASGKKVAICEQLTEPKPGQKIVERDVVRVVSAGTLISDDLLNEKENNYIACAYKNGDETSVAYADITTGEFCVSSFAGGNCVYDAGENLVKISPAEIIVNDEFLLASKDCAVLKYGSLPSLSCYVPWAFTVRRAENSLLEQFNTKTLEPFGVAGKDVVISACGALIEYLRETQKHVLKNIDSLIYLNSEKRMMLDSIAVKNLELVKTLYEGKKRGSLLWLLDKTQTAMGARLLSDLVLNPLNSKEEIDLRLDGVDELYKATVIRIGITDTLKGIKDVERIAGKISNNNLTPRDCLNLAVSLSLIPNLKFQLSGFSSPILLKIFSQLHELPDVCSLLQSAISDNPHVAIKEGGFIREGFNAELDEYRRIRASGAAMIAEIESREREVTGIKNLKIKYNRVFGYLIEVTNSFKDRVPYYYERRQTITNAERYVTQELKEVEEKILNCSDRAIKIELSIFEQIKSILSDNISKFKELAKAIAYLDCLTSFATISKENNYCKPKISDFGGELNIIDGRHPVVETISKEKFVPNDTLIDGKNTSLMIITGPNMAGKSTYMRQNALIVLMAHIGCFVPAKSANIPLIDRIFTRVGASDNLILDQSTFMVEMTEVASILRNATQNSLLILDEVGRGTSTFDGLSIAWAVLEELVLNIKAKTLFATHYHELTELEEKIEGVKNYKVTVKEAAGTVIFLRKIMRGGANKSFGIEVAKLAGVPAVVTEKAKTILKKLEKKDIARNAVSNEEDVFESVDSVPNQKSEVEKILSELDMNNVSPMQAFLILSDLVDKVGK